MVGKDLIMATLFGSGGSSGSGGGGAAGVSPKEVNFYDYDGTCVYAYSVAEAQALSELPAGPEHPGLVFQGWNWSLEGVKGLTRAMNIGAMYTTDDGTTRLYITLQEGRTSPMLGVGVNGTVTVDWGDGTEPDVLTGTSTSTVKWTPNHAYAAPGDYVIRLTVEGEMAFMGENSNYAYVLRHSKYSSEVRNEAYKNALHRVEFGSGLIYIEKYAFQECLALSTVVMSEDVIIMNYGFTHCQFRAINIPKKSASGAEEAFSYCEHLGVVALPENANAAAYSFRSNYCLRSVTLTDNQTTIGKYAFESCKNLLYVYIPSGVTNVEMSAFAYCGVKCFDFTSHTAVPTLENTYAFSGIPADCVFLIPSALYDEWVAATNWTAYANRCVAK